jgi:hypothetical protein
MIFGGGYDILKKIRVKIYLKNILRLNKISKEYSLTRGNILKLVEQKKKSC